MTTKYWSGNIEKHKRGDDNPRGEQNWQGMEKINMDCRRRQKVTRSSYEA